MDSMAKANQTSNPWVKTNHKPLSANASYYGKKTKTAAYRKYEEALISFLQDLEIPDGRLTLKVLVRYSNTRSDIDNCLKPFIDVLQKRYLFNDSKIFKLDVEKQVVKRGDDEIIFKLSEYVPDMVNKFPYGK